MRIVEYLERVIQVLISEALSLFFLYFREIYIYTKTYASIFLEAICTGKVHKLDVIKKRFGFLLPDNMIIPEFVILREFGSLFICLFYFLNHTAVESI